MPCAADMPNLKQPKPPRARGRPGVFRRARGGGRGRARRLHGPRRGAARGRRLRAAAGGHGSRGRHQAGLAADASGSRHQRRVRMVDVDRRRSGAGAAVHIRGPRRPAAHGAPAADAGGDRAARLRRVVPPRRAVTDAVDLDPDSAPRADAAARHDRRAGKQDPHRRAGSRRRVRIQAEPLYRGGAVLAPGDAPATRPSSGSRRGARTCRRPFTAAIRSATTRSR